jgi:hypothetical protein
MALAALGAHELAPAAIFESLGCGLVRFDLWQFFCLLIDYGWMVQTNWGTTPSPVLWRMPSTTVAVQALLALRAQDHKHRTSFQIGLLLDLACIL